MGTNELGYAIPEQDRDLWDCGLSPSELRLHLLNAGYRHCRKCDTLFYPEPPQCVRCKPCRDASRKAAFFWQKARYGPIESCTLSDDQTSRIQTALVKTLPKVYSLEVPLQPEDGFRVLHSPMIGVRRAFIRWKSHPRDNYHHKSLIRNMLRNTLVSEDPAFLVPPLEK